MKINSDLIENCKKIAYYPGYLPMIIRGYMSPKNYSIWRDTISKLDDDSQHEIFRKMANMRRFHLNKEKGEMELKEWIKHNPQYKDFIVED